MARVPALFNVNGYFGCGNNSLPDFRNANELLGHMDRLGIDKALVWHLPTGSDDEMLKEIACTPGAVQRLVPAMSISPDARQDSADYARIKEKVASGEVRAIRVLLAKYRNRLTPLEPLLEEIKQYKPVLLFDTRDPLKIPAFNTDHLMDLADKFPQIPMVYLQCEWITLGDACDLMRYRDNIYLDTSWLHMDQAIEHLIKDFGVDRLLFGVGPRSHNGASLAALVHADISEEARELIAHGNLDKLLNLESTRPLCEKPGAGNTLWDKLMRKEPIDIDIVDAHTHIGSREEADRAVKVMDRLGIKMLVSVANQAIYSDPIPGNWELLKDTSPYANRFLGYVVYNGHYHDEITTERLDEYFANPFFVGFKILNFYWNIKITDPRFSGLWEYADKHSLPILIHTWNDEFDSPAMLTAIVQKYKHAKFILGHSGGEDEGRLDAEALAQQFPNVILEFCGTFPSVIRWEDTLKRVSIKQIVYGTDSMSHNMVWELGRILSAELTDGQIGQILGTNIRKVLERQE